MRVQCYACQDFILERNLDRLFGITKDYFNLVNGLRFNYLFNNRADKSI